MAILAIALFASLLVRVFRRRCLLFRVVSSMRVEY